MQCLGYMTICVLVVNVLEVCKGNAKCNETFCGQECVRKCCQDGYVLASFNETACVQSTDEFSVLRRDLKTQGQVVHGMPVCGECDDLKLVPVVNDPVGKNRKRSKDYCVDKIAHVSTKDAYGLVCQGEEEFDAEEMREPLTSLQKCCPPGFGYDVTKRICGCQQHAIQTNVPTLVGVDEHNPILIDLYYGNPVCSEGDGNLRETLVDLLLPVSEVHISRNGHLNLSSNLYRPGKFCFDHPTGDWDVPNNTMAIRVCKARYCDQNPCIRKCCPEGKSYFGRRCMPSDKGFEPSFYEYPNTPINMSAVGYGVVHNLKCEHGKFALYPNNETDIHFLVTNGSLYVPSYKTAYPPQMYCLEHAVLKEKDIDEIIALLCFTKPSSPSRYKFYSVGLLISCVFLLLTFIVYLLVPKLQNMYGKTLMCYLSSVFFGYLFLAIVAWRGNCKTFCFCQVFAVGIQFAFLTAFSWLNVMCFDIWWIFGGFRGSHSPARNQSGKRIYLLALYALGFPCVLTAITLTLDLLPHTKDSILSPGFGEKKCWFKEPFGLPIILFFSGPICLIIACNAILFALTARNYTKIKAEIGRMTDDLSDSRKTRFKSDKNRVLIYLKLFVVMGVCWTLEFVSWAWPDLGAIWYFTDAINLFHGVFIFFIFAGKKQILQSAWNNLPWCEKKTVISGPQSSDDRNTESSSVPKSLTSISLSKMNCL